MNKYDLYKIATQKVLSEEYCVLSIKVANCDGANELSAIGVVDKNEEIVLDMNFEPLRDGETEKEGVTYFKNEFNNILRVLSRYSYIVVFNETATRKLFVKIAEKYGLNVRLLDKPFKKFFCAQTLYDAYIGFNGTKLEIACKVEHVDDSNAKDAVSVSYILQEFIKTIANEYTYPNPNEYASLAAKMDPKPKKEKTPKKNSTVRKPRANYVELFNSGKSIEEIATFADIKAQTVENYILNAYERGQVDNVDSMIQIEYVQCILNVINATDWDGRLRSVKDALPEECTYASIRAVIAKNKKGCHGISTTQDNAKTQINVMIENAAESANGIPGVDDEISS